MSLAPLFLALVLTAGCGKKEECKVTTQVAAKVNADEITVHQVNNVLARAQNVTPETAPQAKREILNKLIDQQLAKQQAIEKKFDRSPAVVQAVEAARSEILARAYLEQIAAAQPKPTAEEVKQYFVDHPYLFTQRRIYALEQILVMPKEGLAPKLRAQVGNARSMKEIAAWLRSQDAKFGANRATLAAEQIEMQLVPKLQAMKVGEIGVFESGGRLYVIHLLASRTAPVDEATATPRIQQVMFNERSRDAIAREMKRIKDQSKIAYLGEFESEAAAAEAKAKAETEARTRAEAEAKAKAEKEAQARADTLAKERAAAEAKARLEAASRPQPKPTQLPQDTIEKGVQGLK